MSRELEKCTRNGKQTQQSLRHWCCSLASPCDCSPGIFLLCREDGKKDTQGKKSQHHCCKRYSSPEKSCHQPAEEITEQTLLKTRNTSSLSFQPLSVKAKLYHKRCRGSVVCHWLRGCAVLEGSLPSQDRKTVPLMINPCGTRPSWQGLGHLLIVELDRSPKGT